MIDLNHGGQNRVLINPARIVWARVSTSGGALAGKTLIRMSDGSNVYVAESLDEILNLIRKEK